LVDARFSRKPARQNSAFYAIIKNSYHSVIKRTMSQRALNHPFTLSSLAIGQVGTISAVAAEPALEHRLRALGFKVGKSITVMRRASFNGPIHVRLGATDVILRPNDAKRIHLHPAS